VNPSPNTPTTIPWDPFAHSFISVVVSLLSWKRISRENKEKKKKKANHQPHTTDYIQSPLIVMVMVVIVVVMVMVVMVVVMVMVRHMPKLLVTRLVPKRLLFHGTHAC
jgi:uncharacterized membrane protein